MNLPIDLLNKFRLEVGGIVFESWQVLSIIFLLFLLVIAMAMVRRHFLEFTVRGAGVGIVLGFFLAIVLEGLLLMGGKTFLISTLGWENAPKPIQKTIDTARSEFIKVLGSKTDLENECEKTVDSFVENLQKLTPSQAQQVRFQICQE